MRTPRKTGSAHPPRARRAAAVAIPVALLFLGCAPQRDAVAAQGVEICDGVDNDGDGVADDLDADRDGVCDCLRVGVFGYPSAIHTSSQVQALMHRRAVPTTILAGRVLTPEVLAALDVLVVQDVEDGTVYGTAGQQGVGIGIGRTVSDAEVQAVGAWVAAGGGLMTLAGYDTSSAELANVNRLLAPFGLSYASTPLISEPVVLPVTHWDATHPLAAGVSQVGVSGAYPVLGAGTAVAWEPSPGAYDLGRALESGRGRVFAWGDEWITFDVEWSTTTFQVQRLWQNALGWLTPPGRCRLPLP